MKKLFLILVVMSSLSACKSSPYAYFDKPLNPICLKSKYYKLSEAEAIALYDNLTPINREIIEMNRTTIGQECGK